MLEKCCLQVCANSSYQNAQAEIEALTGVKVGHSTHQRLVNRQDLPLPEAKQAVSELSVDGGKVRLRGEPKAGSRWRDYKAVRLQGIYYAAFFDLNQSLIDYVNSQPLTNPLVCLGDGHEGVWNLIREFGVPESRWEILDWYHLKENLYKVGGSLKRLKQAESLLWHFVKWQKPKPCLVQADVGLHVTSALISTSIVSELLTTATTKLSNCVLLGQVPSSPLSNRLAHDSKSLGRNGKLKMSIKSLRFVVLTSMGCSLFECFRHIGMLPIIHSYSDLNYCLEELKKYLKINLLKTIIVSEFIKQ